MSRLVLAVCISIAPAAADRMPLSCGPVGAKSYTPPQVTIPAVDLNRGTVITVTNATVAINGDTSSVAALVANPGPDGISIQEAIMATNSDPGTWNIQFAPALKGSTIVVDSGPLGGLSYLTGGNVTINGDIDGDGVPDITLTSMSGTGTAFFVISGGNTLYGLALQNCGTCVTIQRPSAKFGLPAATGTTFSNITIANLVMTSAQTEAIVLNPLLGESDAQPTDPALVTGNTWDHLLIVGNTISGTASGPQRAIDVTIGGTVGDTLQHATIANNNIVLPASGALGINFVVGAGLGSTTNQALDTLIANNTIAGALPQSAIWIGEGQGSASANLIDGLEIVANRISITRTILSPMDTFPTVMGIELANGDAASDDLNPPVLPVQYSENNILRNVSILSNTIAGAANIGISLQVACCGNGNNTISDLSILGNTMTGLYGNGVLLVDGEAGGYFSRPSTGNVLSNVLIQSNSIQVTSLISSGCNCYQQGFGISFGGIQIWAGLQEPGNTVRGLSIANNDVNTPLVGIGVIGGIGGGANAPPSPANSNVVSALQIFCNQVDQIPTLGLDYPGITGIDVTAGLLAANGNVVHEPRIEDNLIGGVLSGASFFTNLGGASGNTISVTGGAARRRPH